MCLCVCVCVCVRVRVCVCVCVYDSVVGSAFYVMDYVRGRIFTDPLLPGLSAADRRDVYESMCRVLADIHSVDVDAAQLNDFTSSRMSTTHSALHHQC